MMVQQLVVMLAMGLASATSGLQPQQVTVHKLKFVAAEDVAKVVTKYAEFKNLSVELSTDLRTNSVIVTGDLAQQKQVVGVIAAIDKEPETTLVKVTILKAPATFADDVGLGAGALWVLTLREAKMLTAQINSQHDKRVEVKSTSQLLLSDNRQGFLHHTGNEKEQLIQVTKRIIPDKGSNLLRIQYQFTLPTQTPNATDTRLFVAMVSVKDAHTVVVRGPRVSKANEDVRDIFIIMKVHSIISSDQLNQLGIEATAR